MPLEPVARITDTQTSRIPTWLGWAWVVLAPVTAFWLSLYSLPFILFLGLFLGLLTYGYGVVLIPLIWLFVVGCLTLLAGANALLLLRDAESGRSAATLIATLSSLASTGGLWLVVFTPIFFTPRLPSIILMCLLSAIWYSLLPWLLTPGTLEGSSSRPVPEGSIATRTSFHKFAAPSRGLSLVLLMPVLIPVAVWVRPHYADWQRPRIHGEPMEALRDRSAKGEVDAQSQLAERFTLGIGGVLRDDAQAAFWQRKQADQGDRVAQYRLGAMYLVGQGVPRDNAQAALWVSLAGSDVSSIDFWRCADLAERIAAVASKEQLEEGRRLAHEWRHEFEKRGGRFPDSAQSITRLRLLADGGDADAQERLGLAYLWSLGVTQDFAEAARWNRLAGKQGRHRSSYRLAVMYGLGQGVPRDSQEAEGWYQKSGQGDSETSYQLGLTHQTGHGVPKDSVRATELFRKAARDGSVRAAIELARMYEKGDGVPADPMRGAAWFRRAADHLKVWPTVDVDGGALDFAEGARARDDEDFVGDPRVRYERALAWFTQGADRGHDEAQYSAALMYESGQGTPQDSVKALAYATLAAAQPLATHWKEACQLRDRLAARLTQPQLDEAQRLIQRVKEESIRHPGDRWD